jgi:chaperonin GroEL
MKERKERVIDAVEATKSAVEEGVIAGGGVALLYAREALVGLKKGLKSEVVRSGVDIIYSALSMPITKILSNAGVDTKDVIDNLTGIWNADESKAGKWGFDVETEKYGDMFQMGILDPKKVTKSALLNASSIASMLLTAECFMAFEPEEKKEATPKE